MRRYMEFDVGDVAQIATISTVVIAGIAIAIKTYVKTLNIPNKGEQSLITLMHTELERMSSQNATLSEEVGKLQKELLRLNNQLIVLSLENRNLQAEVINLHNEIARIQTMYTSKGDKK